MLIRRSHVEVDESATTSDRATMTGLCGAGVFTLNEQRVEGVAQGVDVPLCCRQVMWETYGVVRCVHYCVRPACLRACVPMSART